MVQCMIERKTTPAASDLPERAKELLRGWSGSSIYSHNPEKAGQLAAEFAAIRTEAESAGWKAGVEAMRELAGYVAIHACLVPPDGGAPTEEEREMCAEVARQIYASGMPLNPRREGK